MKELASFLSAALVLNLAAPAAAAVRAVRFAPSAPAASMGAAAGALPLWPASGLPTTALSAAPSLPAPAVAMGVNPVVHDVETAVQFAGSAQAAVSASAMSSAEPNPSSFGRSMAADAGFNQARNGKAARSGPTAILHAEAAKNPTPKPAGKPAAAADGLKSLASVAAAPKAPLSRAALDAAWAAGNLKSGDNTPVPAGDASFRNPEEKIPAGPNPNGLQPAPKSGRRGMILRAAVAAVPLAVIPAAFQWATEQAPVVTAWGDFTLWFASLPGWAQTGSIVAGGFAAAAVLPRVIERSAKWVFKHLDWDPLREAFLVNVVTTGVWIGAVGFAILQLGGTGALALNGTVFGVTMTLAQQDLIKSVVSGFSLYQNRPFELGDRIAVEDPATGAGGRVIAFNPRFITLDARDEAGEEYETILMPNDVLIKKTIINKGFAGTALFGAAAFLAGLGGPALMAAQIFAVITVALAVGGIMSNRANAFETKARDALPDLAEYHRLNKRAKMYSWIANGAYLLGLAVILNMYGVPLSGIVSAMSLVSAAMGFWTKDAAANLVAGLMIAVWKPFGKGDEVKIGKHEGRVDDITQRYIRLQLADGGVKYIPLQDLMSEVIRVGRKPVAAIPAANPPH